MFGPCSMSGRSDEALWECLGEGMDEPQHSEHTTSDLLTVADLFVFESLHSRKGEKWPVAVVITAPGSPTQTHHEE